MKLLFLDQFSDLGGAQQVLLEFLPAVGARGWKALVGLPGAGPAFARAQALGFESAQIPCGPYRSGRKTPFDLARFAISTPRLAAWVRRHTDVDLIYVNGPRLLPAVALARHSAPVVFHAHSLLPAGSARRLAGESIKRAKAWVIANCEFVAEPLRAFAGERLSVIYNGVPAPYGRDHKKAPFPRVGCIGRIAPEKGQLEFVQAATLIHREMPACRFVVYGSPLFGDSRYAEEVKARAHGLPLDFAGWCDNAYDALAKLDVLLVPSGPNEATTRVIPEAFAAGVPVVALRGGGIPEVIDHGRTGYLADTIGEMAGFALSLLRVPQEALIVQARASFDRRFTLARFHSELFATLERIIGAKRN